MDLNLLFKQSLLYMILRRITFWVLAILCLAAYGCNDSTIVGSDLLDDQSINLDFTDTITLKTSTISGEPILVDLSGTDTYMVGDLEDPIFGTTKSDLYFFIQALDISDPWNFANDDVDSIVLTIAIDTFGVYGENPDVYRLELFEGIELLPLDTIFSDQSFAILPDPIAVFEDSIDVSDTLSIFVPDIDTTFEFNYHVRMKMNDAFTSKLFTALNILQDNAGLSSFLPSLYLSATSENASLLGLSIGEAERVGNFNTMSIYTTDRDNGRPDLYELRFGIDRSSNFVHDDSGSLVEATIHNPDADGEFFYVQGMAGVRGVIDVSAINNF